MALKFSPARLDSLRRERNLTVTDLAALAGIPKWTFYDYVHGRSAPRVKRLASIADALDVSVADLFEESGDE